MVEQLPLFGARVRPTRPLLAHPRHPGLLRRLRVCLSLFPELQDHRLTVGITRVADGIAELDTLTIRFDLRRRLPTHYTIGHELTHLLQALEQVPGGEVQCDIWTLARDHLFLDEAPCYLPLPAIVAKRWTGFGPRVATLCARAIRVRRTRRTYIRWLKNELAQLPCGTAPTGVAPRLR